jgi:hypothetical protein
VIPPFNQAFIDAVQEGTIKVLAWSAALVESSKTHAEIEVSVRLELNGEELTTPSKRVYEERSILVADDLPYITMWPYVKASADCEPWKEYFVGILTRNYNEGSLSRPAYDCVKARVDSKVVEPLRALPIESIEFTVVGEHDSFEVTTDPFGNGRADLNGKFMIQKSEFFPEFLRVSYRKRISEEPILLGFWQINDHLATELGGPKPNNATPDEDTAGIIGFDFATSATVETLFSPKRNESVFIDGPGAYLHDVFNPLWTDSREAEYTTRKGVWEQIQTY